MGSVARMKTAELPEDTASKASTAFPQPRLMAAVNDHQTAHLPSSPLSPPKGPSRGNNLSDSFAFPISLHKFLGGIEREREI
jgi:hypothetical protein